MARDPLIDRKFLEKLERLTIRWQKSFPGLVGGHNRSRFSGPGQEFLDHRHFHHGDDLRAVNWRAYLRLEKLFLKMFQVEPRIPVRLLLDASSSMAAKFDYARRIAAAICYVGLVRLDTISVQPFTDTLADSFVSCGGRHRFAPVVDFLSALETRGRTNFLQLARQFVAAYPQRGLLILISDFLDDADCIRPLQFLSDFGHELFLIHVYSDEDRSPPWEGELELVDAESGARLALPFSSDARESYVAAFDAYGRALQEMVLRNGGRYAGLATSTPVEEAVFGPLVQSRGIE